MKYYWYTKESIVTGIIQASMSLKSKCPNHGQYSSESNKKVGKGQVNNK